LFQIDNDKLQLIHTSTIVIMENGNIRKCILLFFITHYKKSKKIIK